MNSGQLVFLLLSFTLHSAPPQGYQAVVQARSSSLSVSFEVSTPFSISLDTLQNQLNYTFKSVDLLRRAMTHASFSEENNKALSILGESVFDTAVAMKLLSKNEDVSSKDLNLRIAEVSKVDGSCSADGTRLGLQKIVRVSNKTNATAPAVVCGAFRAIFGAIAVDAGSSDEAGRMFVVIRGGIGRAMAM